MYMSPTAWKFLEWFVDIAVQKGLGLGSVSDGYFQNL